MYMREIIQKDSGHLRAQNVGVEAKRVRLPGVHVQAPEAIVCDAKSPRPVTG